MMAFFHLSFYLSKKKKENENLVIIRLRIKILAYVYVVYRDVIALKAI